jgi:AraC-like DNA-binding protein
VRELNLYMKTDNRIFMGKALAPTSILEQVNFNSDRPYTISIKYFEKDDITIPHYSDSIEILACDNLKGTITVDAKQYCFNGKQIFYIPPQYIHSVNVKRCNGVMYVLKISLDALSNFIFMENILKYTGLTIYSQPFVCNEFESIHNLIEGLIENDKNIFLRLHGILEILRILSEYFVHKNEDVSKTIKDRNNLKEIINWSMNNYDTSIEQAAKNVNYSKYYFCRWFKKLTGLTYNNYLKHLKIEHACRLLVKNKSVSQVASICGYKNISYFIRIFADIKHCTPKQYIVKYTSKKSI